MVFPFYYTVSVLVFFSRSEQKGLPVSTSARLATAGFGHEFACFVGILIAAILVTFWICWRKRDRLHDMLGPRRLWKGILYLCTLPFPASFLYFNRSTGVAIWNGNLPLFELVILWFLLFLFLCSSIILWYHNDVSDVALKNEKDLNASIRKRSEVDALISNVFASQVVDCKAQRVRKVLLAANCHGITIDELKQALSPEDQIVLLLSALVQIFCCVAPKHTFTAVLLEESDGYISPVKAWTNGYDSTDGLMLDF